MLEGRKRKFDRAAHRNRSSSPAVEPKNTTSDDNNPCPPNEDCIMTRKPIRTRRPRIPLIQSGYCAICNLPYNSVDDHVQSKKHQKLIGEDANYIALNGYIHSDVGIESLLSLTGIDALGFDDFPTPKTKRRNMPRTRSSSVVSDIVKPTPTSDNDVGHHRLRSRKNINYMTPPLDEDSFQEKPDLEPAPVEYKEYRELRSSTRAFAKLTAVQDTVEPEVWNSGRPKRACINRQKRISADERLVSDNKTYYKVEVLSNKLRSSDRDKGTNRQRGSKGNSSEKGLIVKFKKLRNSELTQLNNEATNFLFPKKDDTSDEDEEEDGDEEGDEQENETEEEIEIITSENNDVSSSSELEDVKPPPQKFKVEEDVSMDSVSSYCKTKKKRRSHAEAFILDNQKYYKFETPASSSYRLRYHGSYLSPVPTKSNGDCVTKFEAKVESKVEKQREMKKEKPERLKVNLDEFKFSFETVPENEKWYKTFRRQDRSEQSYQFSHNYHWDDFVMPYQMQHLKPMDPRTCYNTYKDLLKELDNMSTQSYSEELTSESDSNACDNEVACVDQLGEKEKRVELQTEQTDDDSKLSEISLTSACTTTNDVIVREPRRPGRKRKGSQPTTSSSRGRNPRKSPRQHASTLAILSSLIHSRKRRSRNPGVSEATTTLQTIPEEPIPKVVERKPVTPQRRRKKKVDYCAIAAQIDEELNTAFDGSIDFDLEPTTEPDFLSFKESRLNVDDIMKMYEESTAKENENSCRRFFNGAPGRKPGKRKKNKTGWPNKVKKRKRVKGENESSTGDAGTVESDDDDDDDEDEEDENEDSDSIIDVEDKECNHDDRENKCDPDITNRVENNSEIRDTILQPYVYVKKLDTLEQSSDIKVKLPKLDTLEQSSDIKVKLPKRTIKRPQRRIKITSPKSPRMLRRSKGRWYRER